MITISQELGTGNDSHRTQCFCLFVNGQISKASHRNLVRERNTIKYFIASW